ncbi:hypothetical protein PVAND_012483 [Polypedilum vanderplanki]|uniref:Protein quiver n=1 Tax=Polypedilum vanderplanki TaxID=319348 RepID=A0A9J6CNJ2_POLVA|nr:hypothetical protein PVAND_012483 [Polypedilum vanderplanki]
MKNSVLILSVLFCITIIPNNVNSIRCYDCDNLTGGNCNDLKDDMIKDCSGLVTTCIKTFATGPEVDYMHRSCGPLIKIVDNDCIGQEVAGHNGTYCECDTDLCNGSNNIYTKTALVISLLFAIIGKFVF